MSRIRMVAGERARDFVLSHADEIAYIEFAPQPPRDIATLVLDTGLRISEVLSLSWSDIHLSANGSQ